MSTPTPNINETPAPADPTAVAPAAASAVDSKPTVAVEAPPPTKTTADPPAASVPTTASLPISTTTTATTTATSTTGDNDIDEPAMKKPPAPIASHAASSTPSSVAATAPPRTSSKSQKKKKSPPAVAMAAAAAAAAARQGGDGGGSTGAQGENTGRWTAEEHRLFLQGLELHGKGWKKIASLIKSRTVVQIRTHAQKYFQKLAKARQNGEEGEIAMEGRGGPASVTAVSPATAVHSSKRRRHSHGTKRKVIQSVVASAQRQGKKFGTTGPDGQPLPTAAPALAHFVLPVAPSQGSNKSSVPSVTTAQGTISGPALEDSLFRFLTPVPVAASETQVNEVARSAGANPITLPTENSGASSGMGDIGSPTGVTELSVYPSWTDAKDTPSWYTKGADVDALLEVGDTLEWLADTGDLHESYQPPAVESSPEMGSKSGHKHGAKSSSDAEQRYEPAEMSATDMSVSALPSIDANNVDNVVPPLPSLFDGSTDDIAESMKKSNSMSASAANLEKAMSSHSIDDHLQVFDTPMEEHDFVTTILENANESHNDLPNLS